ncbi:MAG: hypothetical protein DRI69_08570 [Bacteroidetes bacterium]|nr:MAG: hypothetical protein DRI69_08570 [Bacteroidota bacterium]
MTKDILFALSLIIAAGIVSARLIEPESRDQHALFTKNDAQRSITFIMGEDKTDKPFYSLASTHFTLDQDEGTDYVVQSCRTLGGVIDYLNVSEERGDQPWSVVNIVAHGNPQNGFNLKITEDGHKATPKRLVQAVLRGDAPSFLEGVLDSMTKINFWSCGIGKSPLIKLALGKIFRPASGDSANVYCSPHFVIFHPSETSAVPHRLKASYWPYYFKRGYRPGDLEISKALRSEYPDANIDWDSALERQQRTDNAEAYHGEYHIPVSYTKIYPTKDARPHFGSQSDKIAWAISQPAIMEQIEESGIPLDRFQWTINKIIYSQDDGSRVPAIKAIGMATVLYILQEEPAP